jgi:hypothetical protein
VLLGTFPVSPKTGVNFVLVEDSLADVMVLRQQTPQRRNWANGGAGPHFNRLFPQIHALLCFVFNSDAIQPSMSTVRGSRVHALLRHTPDRTFWIFRYRAVQVWDMAVMPTCVPEEDSCSGSFGDNRWRWIDVKKAHGTGH